MTGFRRRLAAVLAGREHVPEGFTGTLDPDERVLAEATGPRGSVVLATDKGLWLPPTADAGTRRIAWHLVSRAAWQNGALEVVEAREEADHGGGVVLLADLAPRRVPLPEPGKLPETVQRRVTDIIVSREHHELGGGGVWAVQRKVRGVGVVVHLRPDPGTDPEAVRILAEGVGEKLRAVRG